MNILLKNIIAAAVCALLFIMINCVSGAAKKDAAKSGVVRPYSDEQGTTNQRA